MNETAKKFGWVKLVRSPATQELLSKDPLAYILLSHVALRARWSDGFDADGLTVGQALIGDYAKMKLTRCQYRTRLDRLVKWKFLTIQTTNRGTVATLTDTTIFDIQGLPDSQQNSQRAANGQPTDDQQIATKEDRKQIRQERKESSSTATTSLSLLPPAVGEKNKSAGALAREEIWERTCRAVDRGSARSISEAEQEALTRCASWLTEADMQLLEVEEHRVSAYPGYRQHQTAHSFLHHAAVRLNRLKGQEAVRAAEAARLPATTTESNEDSTNRTLPVNEIWRRACNLMGKPNEVQTQLHCLALNELQGIREWTLRLVECYVSYEKKQRGSRGPRTVLTLLKEFDLQLRFAERWDELRQKEQQARSQPMRGLGDPQAAQPASQSPAQVATSTQIRRPTVDEVFAYMKPGGWGFEVAQAYIDSRTRTFPQWHLPATNERPARLIGPDWHPDANSFLKNWNEAEAKKARERERADLDNVPF